MWAYVRLMLSGMGSFSPVVYRSGRGLRVVDACCAGEDMGKLLPLVSRHVGSVRVWAVGG